MISHVRTGAGHVLLIRALSDLVAHGAAAGVALQCVLTVRAVSTGLALGPIFNLPVSVLVALKRT